MFKIGEFSRLGQVTIETLRHYDTLGLLKPAKVDPFTGYRTYSARQLPDLNRILALKELGFSLAEIARILQDDLTTEQLRGMLKMQLLTAERDLQMAQSRLDQISARLNYLNLEDSMPAYEVTLKPVAACTVAAIREVVPDVAQMPARCGAMFNTVATWMAAQKLPFGTPLTMYYNESYTQENIDTECAIVIPGTAVDNITMPPQPIVVRELEAAPQMATTVVAEDFYQKINALAPAYNALGEWIEAHGYRIVGPPRELFHGSVQNGDLTAEIQFPVEKV